MGFILTSVNPNVSLIYLANSDAFSGVIAELTIVDASILKVGPYSQLSIFPPALFCIFFTISFIPEDFFLNISK